MNMPIDIPILMKAVTIVGNQEKLAIAINVTQPTVSNWLSGKPMHPKYHASIQMATNNEILKEELCPDMYLSENLKDHIRKIVKKELELISINNTAH